MQPGTWRLFNVDVPCSQDPGVCHRRVCMHDGRPGLCDGVGAEGQADLRHAQLATCYRFMFCRATHKAHDLTGTATFCGSLWCPADDGLPGEGVFHEQAIP